MLVVIGGGPGGVAASIGAARMGCKVILIERYGFLGGMATAGAVHPWMDYHSGNKLLVGGIFAEIVDKLKELGSFKTSEHFGNVHHCFDLEALKYILQELCLQAGVELILHSFVDKVKVENNEIKGVYLSSKSGREFLPAQMFVDATGDGDIASLAGVPYEKGRPQDGLMQPATLHFRMGGVDISKIPSRDELNILFNKAKKEGKLNIPRENLLWFDTIYPDQIHFNATRIIKIDGTSRSDLARGEIEAHRQVWELVNFLRKISGFHNSYLLYTAPQLGIRETRRIIGKYILTAKDLLECKIPPDCIALGAYPLDIHNPEGEGTIIKHIPAGKYYGIPYRTLIPQKVQNLLVVGRCISADWEAFSSIRIQPTCYATGQAGGVAGALALIKNTTPSKLLYSLIQEALLKQGAVLN